MSNHNFTIYKLPRLFNFFKGIKGQVNCVVRIFTWLPGRSADGGRTNEAAGGRGLASAGLDGGSLVGGRLSNWRKDSLEIKDINRNSQSTLSRIFWFVHTSNGHPMSADPGPPTQLCTQNTKWKNVKKVRREGPPTTQLCHTNQTQNQNSFCAWGPLGGPENSRELRGPDAKPLRT